MIDRFLIALCHHHFRSERQFVFHEIVLVDIGLGFFLIQWLNETEVLIYHLWVLQSFFTIQNHMLAMFIIFFAVITNHNILRLWIAWRDK